MLPAPAIVDFEFMQIAPDINKFNVRDTAVAVLLEGKFNSLYANRASRSQLDSLERMGVPFRSSAPDDTRMIIVADGDIAMGMNLFTKYTYANKEFFTNSLEYLVNPSDILETRAKSFTLRLLDPVKVNDQKTTWQLINIALPILLIIIAGWIYQQVRKRKYA